MLTQVKAPNLAHGPRGPQARGGLPQKTGGVEIITVQQQLAERRSEPRAECNEEGYLLFLSSQEIIKCKILDQSASGAKVAFEGIDKIPNEIWLIDLKASVVKCGRAAWNMRHQMGLKFSYIQKLDHSQARPSKVPSGVFEAWLRLAGLNQAPEEKAPEAQAPNAPEDNSFYLD